MEDNAMKTPALCLSNGFDKVEPLQSTPRRVVCYQPISWARCLLAMAFAWVAAVEEARCQIVNFTNQQSGSWSDVNAWVNGASGSPTNGGGTNYVINFNNAATDYSTNDLWGGGALTNFYLNQLNFGGSRVYLTTAPGAGVSNFVFSYNNGLPRITQNSWATSVISTVNFILDTNLLVSGTGGGAPLTGSILTFSNRVGGVGGLIMNGAFTLRLASSNAYMGGTILSNGIIQVANSNALGTGGTYYLIQAYGNNAGLDLGGADLANATGGGGSKTVMISGMGLGPNTGIIFNTGGSLTGKGLRNVLLASDSAIGQDGGGRFDIIGTLNGSNRTLYKVGNNQVAMANSTIITNMNAIVVNSGRFTLQGTANLSGSGKTLFQIYTGGVFGVFNTVAFTNAMDMRGGTFENNGGGITTWNGPIELNGSTNTFQTAGGDMFLGGNISGDGLLVKVGTNALTLSGVNTYTGGTFVSSGLVVFASASALPSTPAVVVTLGPAGGVGATGAYSTVMDWLNSGKIALREGGFVALATNSSETVDYNVGGGYTNMFLASMDRSGLVSFKGALTPVSTNYCLGGFGNLVLPTDNVLTNLYNASANLVIGPTNALANIGYVMLVGSNTYSGVTIVNSNQTLSIGTTANIGGDGKTVVLNGAGLQIRGTALTNTSAMTIQVIAGGNTTFDINNNGNNFALNNNLTGSGSLTKQGMGTWVLGGTNGLTGRLYVEDGVVRITNSLGLAAGSNVFLSGSALELGTNIERVVTGTDGNSRRIIISGSGIDNDGALRINSNFFQGILTNYASIRLTGAARVNADLGITLIQAGLVSNFGNRITFGGYGNIIVTNRLGGTGGVAKDGSGMLTIGGRITNAWGGTFVNAGVLRLDYGLVASGLNANMVTNTAVTIGSSGFSITTGGTLVVNGPTVARTSTQWFNSLTIGPGNNRLIVSNGAGNVELNLSNVFRAVGGGALDVSFGSGSLITSMMTNSYAGVLGLSAPGLNGTNVLMTVGFTDWAMATNFTVSGAKITNYIGYTDAVGGDAIGNNSNNNVRLIVGGTGDLFLGAGVTAINSLAATTASARTVGFAGQMLRMGQTAGILLTPTSGGLTLGSSANDGFLTAGGDTNTAGELVIINYSSSTATINASIISNGTGAVTVTVAGNGPVNFMGDNSFNQAFVNGGNVTFSGNNTITGPSALTIYAGSATLAPSSVNTFGGTVLVDGGGVLNVNGPVGLTSNLRVGATAGSRAVMNIGTNLTITRSGGNECLRIGVAGAGAVYQTGGVVTITDTANNEYNLGLGSGGSAYYRITNGELNVNYRFSLGVAANSPAVFDLLGGAVTIGEYIIHRGDSPAVLNIAGGRLNAGNLADTALNWDQSGYGVINVGGFGANALANFAMANNRSLDVGHFADGAGVLNIRSGGTVIANRVYAGAGATVGSAVLNFDGGTLRAATGTTFASTFMSGLTDAYIYSGGATMDTGTNNVTVSVSLRAPTGYGLANIAIADKGVGYIGAPVVMITGGSGTGATAVAQVDLDPASPTYQQLVNIIITSAGSGYYSNDVLNVTMNGGGPIQAGRLGAFTFGANSSGGGLTKEGSGTLILTADNSYSGPTIINGGYLLVNSTGQPGLTALTLTNLTTAGIGLTVAMDQSFLTWLNGKVVAPTTNVVVLGASTASDLAFTAANTSNMFLGGLGVTYSGSASWTDSSTLRLGGAPGLLTYASAIGGATNVLIGPPNGNASSTVLLAASNSFAATLIVNSGSLTFTNDYNLGDPNNVVVLTNGGGLRVITSTTWNPNRSLNLTNGGGLVTVDGGSTLYVKGSITGVGSLTKTGSGTLTILANPSHTGGTFLGNGIFSIGNADNIGGAGANVTFAGGALQVRDVLMNSFDGLGVNWTTFNGTLDINNNGNRFTITNDLDGAVLTKSGQGLLVLGGDNSSASLTGLVVQSGAVLMTNGLSLAAGSNVVLSGGAIWFGSNIVTAGQLMTLNGTGALGNDGALRNIGGYNTNAGPITLGSAARIGVDSGSTLFLTGPVSNGTYALSIGAFGSIVSRGGIYGSGGLTKERSGTLTLEGYTTNAFGNTTVDGGTLLLNYYVGSVVSNLIATNSALTLGSAAYSMTTGGTLIVNGPAAGGAITQSFASLTISGGNNAVRAQDNGGSIFVNFDSIARAAGGGIVDFTLPISGAFTTLLSNNYAGLLSSNGVLAIISGADWAMATNVGGGATLNIVVYDGYTNVQSGGAIANDSNTNVRIQNGGPGGGITLDGAVTTINTLLASDTVAVTNNLAGQTLRLGQTGGILLTPASGGLQIGASVNDGYLTAGGGNNTAGELVFINNSAKPLTVNSMITSNGNGALSVTVNGNGAVNFYGSNAFNRAYINGGTVTFYSTNNISSASPYTQRGGVVIFDAASTNTFAGGAVYVYGGTQIVNGPVNVVGSFNYLVGNSAGDRAVAVVSTNMNLYQLHVGGGASSAGAVYQYGGNVNVNNGFYPANATASGYGYYLLTNGSITAAAVELGAYGAGVMDMSGGSFASSGRFSLARRAGGMGVLDLSGGRVSVAAGNEVTVGMTDAATAYGVINVRGTGVLDAANGSSSKMLNLNVNNAAGGTGIVNLLSGGTIIANKVGATRQGMTVLNFNGGTLQAATNLTVGSTFMTNGLAGAYIYSGGATINTDTNVITIGQSLFAPTGYGLTNIAITSGGSGYIGAPLVYITGGSGTGATAIAQMDLFSGAITNIYITSAGSGYLSNDALNITLIGGGALLPAQLGTFSFGTNSVAGGLTKTGSGDLQLTGTNTYRGVTVLVEGTLVIYSRDNLLVGNTIQFSGGAFSPQGTASLDDYLLSGAFAFDVPLADTLQVNNSLTGPASTLTKLGEGLLVVTGNNDYGSGTFISNGLIRFNAPSNMPTTGLIILEAGSMVSLGTNAVNTGLAPYIGDRDFGAIGLLPTNATENSESINFNNAGSGARVFTNLSFGAGSNLVYTGTYTPYQRDGTNFWRLAAFYGTTLTFSNSMTNYTEASTLEINRGGARGTVALTGTNTYSGGTFIGGGTLSILGDFALGAAPGSPATNVTFQTSATLQFAASMNLDGNRAFSVPGGTGTFDTLANTVVIPGSIGGDGSLNKMGSGSLILNGNPSTLRLLTVNAGTMCLSNTLFTTTGINANGAVIVGDTTNDNNATLIVDTGSAVTSSAGTNNPFTVGNYGSGNTLVVTNGGTVYAGTTNYPGLWLGNQAVSSNNTAIITGGNSLLTSAGRVIVGDDGSFNTMLILDGGTVSNATYVEVGRTGTASNNLLVVSGSGSLLTNTGSGIIVGESGAGNTIIITNGGRVVTGQRFMVGYGASGDSNTAVVGGLSTHLRAAQSIIIGSNGSYNIMSIGNSASVTGSSAFVVGALAGAEGNIARISDTGTVVTVVNEIRIGDGGGTNTMMILTGAVVNVANWVQVGRSVGASSNILFVSGEGACLSNTATANGIIVGNSGADNMLIVTNSARASAPRLALGYTATGSNNVVLIGGAGTLLQIGVNGIQVGTNGSYNTMSVGDSATVTNTGILQIGSVGFASNNTLVISDASTRFYNAGEVWLGYTDTHHNVMQVLNGAVFTNNGFFLIGRRTGASNNTLVVNGASLYNGANVLAVGGAGIGNVAIFTNSAFVMTPEFNVGRSTFATNNAAYITGAGTLLQVTGANGIRVGNGDAFNSLYIANGAAVTNAGALFVGFGAATSNNLLQITNAGSRLWVGGDATLGESAASAVTGNRMVLDSGATGVIRGNLTISTNSVLRNLGTAALYVAGHFDNLSTNVAQNNLNGTLVFDGGTARTQLVEIASAYTISMATTNFMVGTFQIGDSVTGSNAFVRLMDQRANSAGAGNEILVASNLIVATSGSILDLTNHTVFAYNLSNAGTIQQAGLGVSRLDLVNTFTNAGTVYAIGSVLQLSNAFINSASGMIGLNAGTLTNLVVAGTLTNLGTIGGSGLVNPVIGNEPSGAIVATNTGLSSILALSGGFTNSGAGAVNAGLLAALGGGAELRINQSFTNAGTIWMNNASAAVRLTDAASNLVNAAGGLIHGQGALHAFLDNAGTVSNSTGGALTFSLAVNNQAGGSVGAYGGSTLAFNGAVTNSGTITARNGSQLQFNQGLTLAGSGSLVLNPSTAIITGTLLLGSSGTIIMANSNDLLVMRGDFVNGSTDTNNFNMCYGVMTFGAAGALATNTFEVAGTNKSYFRSGFDNNMALGALNVTNCIRFVDYIDNGGGGNSNEVLYVDVLHLFNGATLKLSALTIYVGQQFIYEDGNGTQTFSLGQGGVIDENFAASHNLVNVFLDNGGQIVFVPEPSTGALLGLGWVMFRALRRRRKR